MTSLIQVRDSLALAGRADARQLSLQLNTPQPLVQAMLERLVAMRKAEPVEADDINLSGSCKNCAEGKKCLTVSYRLVKL
ncbi:FeoC-like transcriptional regulator [Hafnia psychrotolerans]|uniref:Probable [Fe-S]-dependent transcriptional repressor n=1 Tax=Hafnia psychrotolerans TaxID=1477018 RepID=A0ABQ1GVM3_9GAMM|nr:FeoC-like transcriptional regulator [Hafnia psychrotolerans]GGA51176.1 putative [Fe-S]-dependent transcriptional repressor [Hafnia psychrotolerans]